MRRDGTLDLLVCEDDEDLRAVLRESFEREGHRVTAVADGRAAFDGATSGRFDLMLLDIALGPHSPDGYWVCRQLRARRNMVPIIVLTAKDGEADAVLGLESGADDYVVKPVGAAELRSRIRAVLRRSAPRSGGDDVLHAGPVTLDCGRRSVGRDGEPVKLTFSEFEVLRALMEAPQRAHAREELLCAIWGDSAYRDPRAVDVHIRHLREKLERTPEAPELIRTVRGLGYRIEEP